MVLSASWALKKTWALALIALVVVGTAAVVGFLVIVTRPTVVELTVLARRATLAVMPAVSVGAAGENAAAPAALLRTPLLAPGLVATALEVRNARCIQATLQPTGAVALLPSGDGSATITMREPFSPELVLNEPAEVSIAARREKVSIDLVPRKPFGEAVDRSVMPAGPRCPEPKPGEGWEGTVPVGDGMRLRLQNVRAFTADGELTPAASYEVPSGAAQFRILGDRAASGVSVALVPPPPPSATMRLLDPETGEVSEPRNLPVALAEGHSVLWHDRLLLLEREPGEPRPVPLLRPDVTVGQLELAGFAGPAKVEDESYVLGGKVRFPAGELEELELEAGEYVTLALDPGKPLRLRSLALDQGAIAITLWGEPTSLRVGLTPDLRSERLPSYFEWLYTHRLVGLIYGTLIYVAGFGVALTKLLGWTKG